MRVGARVAQTKTLEPVVETDAWCNATSVCEQVWRTVGDLSTDIFVVSPALTGPLHSLTSDIDGAVAAAEVRLKAVLDELRTHGVAARGSVGDEDPLLAIADALGEFSPTQILVVTTDPTHQNWRERHIRKRVAAFGLPVSYAQVA